MSMSRWSPRRDVVSLRDAIDRLFEDSFIPATGFTGGGLAPVTDVFEKGDEYHVCVELPGLKPDDVDVTATSDTVTIKGEMVEHEHPEQGNLRKERRYGRFERTITFPTEIDPNKVEASFENGLLNLTLPKSEEVKPRPVKVKAKLETTSKM